MSTRYLRLVGDTTGRKFVYTDLLMSRGDMEEVVEEAPVEEAPVEEAPVEEAPAVVQGDNLVVTTAEVETSAAPKLTPRKPAKLGKR